MDRILVFAPNWLGDVVMALPALAALRQWHPTAHVTAAARASVAPLLTMVGGLDEVVTLTGRGDWRDAAGRKADAARLAEGSFDAALLLPNSFHVAWVARKARIPERWGYSADLRGWLLTRAVPRRHGLTQAAYYSALVTSLGGPETPHAAALRLDTAQRTATLELLRGHGWGGGPLVGFAPGAAFGPAKRWPPERAGLVAARLAAEAGAVPVFVGAPADRPAIDEAIAAFRREASSDASLVDLGGKTDLTALVAVLAECRAVVSNDSGAMHVATAVGTPVAAIFGPTDERATAPLPHPDGTRAAVITGVAACRPCHLRDCPIDHRCMTSISAERVAGVVLAWMDTREPPQ